VPSPAPHHTFETPPNAEQIHEAGTYTSWKTNLSRQ
jgi:cytochrome c oxidase subunit 1